VEEVSERKRRMIRQRSTEMKRIRWLITLLTAVSFFAVLLAQAQSDRQTRPVKINEKAVTKIEPAPTTVPQTAPVIGPRQGYRMVTGVVGGFGGESESDNYRMSVSSGGASSAIGISESDTLVIKAGFVHASNVKHGDANSDLAVALGDAIYILNYLFKGGSDPCPMEAGDANCTGAVDLGDAIFILNYLFKGGPSPTC
jgi:hypothetical protein